MFESSETSKRTGTVIVNCSVYCRSNDDRNRKVFRFRRNISSEGAPRTAAGSHLYSAVTQKPKVQDQHNGSLSYNNNARPKKIKKKHFLK